MRGFRLIGRRKAVSLPRIGQAIDGDAIFFQAVSWVSRVSERALFALHPITADSETQLNRYEMTINFRDMAQNPRG